MVGSLSREDSSPVLEVVEKKPGYHTRILCPDRKGRIVFEPKSIDPSLSLSHSGKRVNIRVNVKVVGENRRKHVFRAGLEQRERPGPGGQVVRSGL